MENVSIFGQLHTYLTPLCVTRVVCRKRYDKRVAGNDIRLEERRAPRLLRTAGRSLRGGRTRFRNRFRPDTATPLLGDRIPRVRSVIFNFKVHAR